MTSIVQTHICKLLKKRLQMCRGCPLYAHKLTGTIMRLLPDTAWIFLCRSGITNFMLYLFTDNPDNLNFCP